MGNIVNKNKINTYPQENNILFPQPRFNTYPQENNFISDLDYNIIEYYLLDKIVNHKLINNDFIKSDKKVIIINIFFTNILFNNIIFNRQKFNNHILLLIEKYVYIKIYKINQDNYILVINFPYTENIHNPANMTVIFCMDLIKVSNKYIDIIISITYDTIHFGLLNNHIKIFSKKLILLSILKNNLYKNCIFSCKDFYKKHNIENDNIKVMYILKKFNYYTFYVIDIL